MKRKILVVFIRFYCFSFSAYKLFKQAADLGHIGAKEELGLAHLLGVHLPMNFNQAKLYFDEGIQTGSAQSHFVCSDLFCIVSVRSDFLFI
jgi:TPR repeat protein